jgi:hypothetical protein
VEAEGKGEEMAVGRRREEEKVTSGMGMETLGEVVKGLENGGVKVERERDGLSGFEVDTPESFESKAGLLGMVRVLKVKLRDVVTGNVSRIRDGEREKEGIGDGKIELGFTAGGTVASELWMAISEGSIGKSVPEGIERLGGKIPVSTAGHGIVFVRRELFGGTVESDGEASGGVIVSK